VASFVLFGLYLCCFACIFFEFFEFTYLINQSEWLHFLLFFVSYSTSYNYVI
jgi:hypothetical protein